MNRTASKLRASIGVEPGRSVPAREYVAGKVGNSVAWTKRSVRHVTEVLRGRPMEVVVAAVGRLGRLGELADCNSFAGESKRLAQHVVDAIAQRWSARLSVHLWDRLELSRSRMDDLRHLLSFEYAPNSDTFAPVVVWQHPTDSHDTVVMPPLRGRAAREKLFAELADAGDIHVGEDGRCERDAIKCASQLYSRFAAAMRSNFSPSRPARPILFFDGTGGSLGKGIAHAELGSADFTGDCFQSRSTLSPLALYEGNDHALPLRANLTLCMDSFIALSNAKEIVLDDGACIPCEPIVVGDMQGLKCVMGMTESCHSVWCKCRARGQVDGKGPQHDYGAAGSAFTTYEEMVAFWDSIGCEYKSEDFILACAHLSKGLYYDGRFTPFTCPECAYSPSASKSKADLAKFNAMTDAEQKVARREHVTGGKHWHVELMMGPMPRGFGMQRVGNDQLHLIYLNIFKHLFKYTIHEPLPVSKRKILGEYLRSAGFYSYHADDESDDPVKRWIGREVKRFLHEADRHLPFMIQLASGPIDVCAETAAVSNAADEEAMDISDDEFEPTDEEVAAEAAEAPLVATTADRWDRFLNWTRSIEVPWGDDTDQYRQQRALEYCNHARAVSRDLYALKPTMESWVPHIACNIAPRQIVDLGDPSRRSADACESFGSCTKKIIKFLTCRRRLSPRFRRGYIEQAFRRQVVRSDLIHGSENAPFLLRKDAKLIGSGCMNDYTGRAAGPALAIRVKVEQEIALA